MTPITRVLFCWWDQWGRGHVEESILCQLDRARAMRPSEPTLCTVVALLFLRLLAKSLTQRSAHVPMHSSLLCDEYPGQSVGAIASAVVSAIVSANACACAHSMCANCLCL